MFSRAGSRIALAIIGICLSATPATAELKLDAPEVLLQRAAKSRVGYFEVLRDIDKNIPEMRLRDEADLYLGILDQLQALGAAQGRDNLGMTVFNGVASRLSNHALRWVRFEVDTQEQVLAPHRYADSDAAYELISEHRDDLPNIVEPEERMRLVENVEALQNFATKAQWPRNVIGAYATLRSEVALEALKDLEKLSDTDRDFWLGHLSPSAGYDYFLRALRDRVLSYSQPDPVRFHSYASILGKMKERVAQAGREAPYYVGQLLGDVARDLIVAHIYQEVMFTPGDFESLLLMLGRSHLQDFVNLVGDSAFAVSPAYMPHFQEKAKLVVARLKELGMPHEADLLGRRLANMK